MKILLITQVVPYPPDAGPKIKTYNVLRYLAQRHEVHLVSFARTAQEEMNARTLGGLCGSVTTVALQRSRLHDLTSLAQSLVARHPFLIERDDAAAMRQAVQTLVRQHSFDAVHADQLTMAQFAVNLPVPLRVLDEHNAVWTIVRRAASRERWGPSRVLAELEWRKLRQYEGEICRRFDLVTVVSGEDYAALAEAARAVFPAKVIPIAVDVQDLRFAPRTLEARHIVSVATMFYPPNVEGVHWFATEVFPLVRRQLPNVLFYVVGGRPPARITGLATEDSGVVVTGYVADLEPILGKCAVMVVPLHSGSGMRVKILEAFARGIPVVSTTVGVEGIRARDQTHLLIADEPQDFARAVVLMLSEPALSVRLARAGRELVESEYDWRTALRGLDEVYR
ncbi:MAG: glycosyltransferase family 4 protein [Chloroflexota bacterium]